MTIHDLPRDEFRRQLRDIDRDQHRGDARLAGGTGPTDRR